MLRSLVSLPARSHYVSRARPSATKTKLPPSFFASCSFSTDASRKTYEEYVASLSPARKKFHGVLNEYKRNNFEHQTPNRFLHEIVKALDSNRDGVITVEEYETLLKNIGARDKMTEQDIHEIFEELGVDRGEKVIPVECIERRWTPYLHVMWQK